VIEMDESASLYDLHEAIQTAVDFDRDHLYSFYTANTDSPYAHKTQLSEEERWEDMEDDFMAITVGSLYPLGRKRLYYLFDFGENWLFEIRKQRGLKKPEDGIAYPRVVESIGPNPEQYEPFED
jgi:hypothetical protein